MTFELPEERDELRHAQRGQDYAAAIHELKRWLRHMRKYADQPPEYLRAIEETEQALQQALEDMDLTWDL